MANERVEVLVLKDENGAHYGIPRQVLEQWRIPQAEAVGELAVAPSGLSVLGSTQPVPTFELSPSTQTWSSDPPEIIGEPTVGGAPVLSLPAER